MKSISKFRKQSRLSFLSQLVYQLLSSLIYSEPDPPADQLLVRTGNLGSLGCLRIAKLLMKMIRFLSWSIGLYFFTGCLCAQLDGKTQLFAQLCVSMFYFFNRVAYVAPVRLWIKFFVVHPRLWNACKPFCLRSSR